MKKHWLVVICGCLILGFQNCSQNGLNQTDLASANLSIVSPSPGSVVDSNSSAEANAAVDAVEISTPQGKLSVDAATGRISLVDENDQLLGEACLGSQEVSELQSYVKSYSLCGKAAVSADTMCAQSYTKGYASLIIGDQHLNLGESFDSCGRGFKDFCGDQAQSFRGLVVYIQKNFQSLACH